MKTSELKHLVSESDLELADDGFDTLSIQQFNKNANELDELCINAADISISLENKFSIYKPGLISTELFDAIIEYAKTPIDERKDEIEATFVPSEIKFAKNTLSNLIISRSKIQKTEGNVNGINHKFKVVFGKQDDFEMLLRILSKASGTEMWP